MPSIQCDGQELICELNERLLAIELELAYGLGMRAPNGSARVESRDSLHTSSLRSSLSSTTSSSSSSSSSPHSSSRLTSGECDSDSVFSASRASSLSDSSRNIDRTTPNSHPQMAELPKSHQLAPLFNAAPRQQAGMPRRSRSLVEDARLDTRRNRQLLAEIRNERPDSRRRPPTAQATPSSIPEEPSAGAAGPNSADPEAPGSPAEKLAPEEEEPQKKTRPPEVAEAGAGAAHEVAQDIERSLAEFPRHISELDHCNHLLIKYEPELDPAHPGFHDLEYRARRKQVAELAFSYKFGERIPEIDYSCRELATWRAIYLRLKEAYARYACAQHNSAIRQLEEARLYSADWVPQLEAVSEFLLKRTGWRLRPVAGLLSARDFLASLAFRVFQTTQYIRHWANPEHSLEPDCIHELMGHIPMLCDPEFAQFSQELGLASLGAPDEQIERFATLYWFTVEFGLCQEGGQLKCYGAGLLSSYGEMEHALESGKPALKEFVPEQTALETYDDSEYQVVYYVARSFEDAKAKMKAYAAANLQRQYELAYDPYTCSIRELKSYEQLELYANSIKSDLTRLSSAISRLKCLSA